MQMLRVAVLLAFPLLFIYLTQAQRCLKYITRKGLYCNL